MNGQMSIFDLLYPDRIDPIVEVAKRAVPNWTTSKQKLIELCNEDPDIRDFAKAVKKEYCPHGVYGHYGGDPHNRNSLQGWDMRNDLIRTWFYDTKGKLQEQVYTWEDFAREIADMIWSGQYTDERKETEGA